MLSIEYPYVSIIIPTYNRSHILPRTLNSIMSQTLYNWECIIVDDYSTDNTIDVVKYFVEKDKRFVLCRNERKKGAQGARNTGVLHSKSSWIIFFDSDNVMHPDMLEKLYGRTSDMVDVCCCFSNVVSSETNKVIDTFEWINEGNIHDRLFCWECYVDFNQAIIRKERIVQINFLDENCPSMQEWDTHIRLSRTSIYTTVQECLLDYYVGHADAISSNTKREVYGRVYLLKKHYIEWSQNKSNLEWILNDIYRLIRKNDDICFRIKSVVDVSRISCRIYVVVMMYRIKYLRRRFLFFR